MSLDMFSKRPIQTDFEGINYVYYYPLTSPNGNNGPIEFSIPANQVQYIDLKDTSIGVTVKVKNGAENLVAAAKVAPVNNFLHSLFSDVTISLNDTTIEGGSHLYPYKAYLTNLLLYGSDAKRTQLQTSGWAKDEAGKFSDATNKGFVTRGSWIKDSKAYYMEGPLLLDIFMQGKLLINQVEMKLRFMRAAPAFTLLSLDDPVVAASVTIESAYLKVKQVDISVDRKKQIETGLALQNAIYPIQRTEMHTYTIPSGVMSSVRENLFHDRRPKLMILGILPNGDFNGSYAKNPFRFPHKKLNSIGIYIDGRSVPQIPLQPDYDNLDYTDVYRNLYRAAGLLNQDGDIDITKNEFMNGYTLYGYILSPDGKTEGGVGQPTLNGNLRIEMRFKEALTEAINVICMAVYDDEVQISRLRKVSVAYMS